MDAVLFDMDGVIVDSERYWHEFEDGELFPTVLTDEYPATDEITGMNYREIYDYLDEEYGTRVEREEFVDLYDRTAERIYGERVTLMDGFPDLLADLRDRGVLVGLVSSAPPAWIDAVVERFDLGPFDLVLSAEEAPGPGKPEPAVYEHAARRLAVEPADCVVVEDSTNGSLAGARAGTTVVGYRTEINADADLSAADAIAEGPLELRGELLDRAAATGA